MIAPAMPAGPRPGNRTIIFLIALTALFLLIGASTIQVRGILPRPTGYSGPEYDAWVRTMRFVGFAGNVLMGVGMFIFFLAGFLVAVGRSDLPEGVRRSMVVGSVALVIAWMIIVVLFGTTLTTYP